MVFFNRLAEIAEQYLRKGSKIYLEGELRTRDWERDGQKHYTTEIVAREMQMLDSRGAGAGDSNAPPPANTSNPKEAPKAPDPAPAPADDFDDDIPF